MATKIIVNTNDTVEVDLTPQGRLVLYKYEIGS